MVALAFTEDVLRTYIDLTEAALRKGNCDMKVVRGYPRTSIQRDRLYDQRTVSRYIMDVTEEHGRLLERSEMIEVGTTKLGNACAVLGRHRGRII